MPDYSEELHQLRKRHLQSPDTLDAYREGLRQLIESARHEDAFWFHYLNAELALYSQEYPEAYDEYGNCRALIEEFLRETPPENVDPEAETATAGLHAWRIDLINQQAGMLELQQRVDEAILLYDDALACYPSPQSEQEHLSHISLLQSKAGALLKTERTEEADALLSGIVRCYQDSPSVEILGSVLITWHILLSHPHDEKKSCALAEQAIADCQKFSARTGHDFSNYLAEIRLCQGYLQDPGESIRQYTAMIEAFRDHPSPSVQHSVCCAMLNRSGRYPDLGDYAAALAAIDELIARFEDSTITGIKYMVQAAREGRELAMKNLREQTKPAE